MDERPPRQPGSSGPPDERSDSTRARRTRPENPYRIPERPSGTRPKDTGGFDFTPARSEGSAVPSEPGPPTGSQDSVAASQDPMTEPWELPRESWEPSREPWESPREPAQGSRAAGPEHQDRPIGASAHSWAPPEAADPFSAPEPHEPRREAPTEAASYADDARNDGERALDPRPTIQDGWGAQGDWNAPEAGFPEGREGQDAPGAGAHRSRSGSVPESAQNTGEDEHGQAHGRRPVEPHPTQQDQGEPSAHPVASAEAWQTPYRGQPTYGNDTPYPGSIPPSPDQGRSGPDEAQDHGEGFEYLYSGPGDPDGFGGPGGPEGPRGPHDPHDDAYDPAPEPRKKRRGLLIGVIATVVVLAIVGGVAGWYVYTLPEPGEATAEYEAAWEEQDYARLAAVTRGGDAEAVLGGIDAGLGLSSVEVEIGAPVTDGGTGSAPYEVTVSMSNAGDWGWEGELPLLREDGQWWVEFSPEVAYPGLGEGQVLARTAVWGERGQIQAADGTRLDTPDVSGSLQMIVGELGEADADDVERLGPAYSVGDTIGKTGLQRTYEERLAGEAATTIVMVDAAEAEEPDSLEATEDNTVVTLDGSDGESITTSIDMNVQNAASAAIIDADDPAGMVAIRPSTGEILAAVNVPGGFNRAFEGQYPPGSSFKIVTYSTLLDNGLSVDGTMNCPEEYDLGGWPFRNAGGAEYGEQSVTEAFATSCNTALVDEIGQRLSPEMMLASAEQFGMNAPLDIGVTTHEPSFPPVDSSTMMGAQGIGQGQILTSPLHMATVPAAVADGSWRHPVLVTEPAREDLPEPNVIGNAEALRPMMRAVITEGTAKDVGFQGEVFGKTGTAEYGTAEDADEDDELPSHAWMVGYKGDVAFAVVVDGGGGGSAVAGPLAAKFTNAL